jgi:hypothetical protein
MNESDFFGEYEQLGKDSKLTTSARSKEVAVIPGAEQALSQIESLALKKNKVGLKPFVNITVLLFNYYNCSHPYALKNLSGTPVR